MVKKLVAAVKGAWDKVPAGAKRVFHTFWQVAGGVLVQHLLAARSSADVKSAVVVAVASGLAAVKALWLASKA